MNIKNQRLKDFLEGSLELLAVVVFFLALFAIAIPLAIHSDESLKRYEARQAAAPTKNNAESAKPENGIKMHYKHEGLCVGELCFTND